jgi:hypothetical protein
MSVLPFNTRRYGWIGCALAVRMTREPELAAAAGLEL